MMQNFKQSWIGAAQPGDEQHAQPVDHNPWRPDPRGEPDEPDAYIVRTAHGYGVVQFGELVLKDRSLETMMRFVTMLKRIAAQRRAA